MTLSRTQIAKFVYVGQGGPLSTIPLQRLCDKGFLPQAVIIADQSHQPRGLNLLNVQPPLQPESLASEAYKLGLAFFHWHKGSESDISAKIAAISPDVVIMSCFPWRITTNLLQIPVHGWWNLHPSLLPAFRGPTPLFWQARAGVLQTGISLHQVEAQLDSGNILAQKTISLRDFSGRKLEEALAKQGAALIEQSLLKLAKGKLLGQPQSDDEASYHGFPVQQDFFVETTGLASKAYHFIRLMSAVYPLWLEINAKPFRVTTALDFNDEEEMSDAYRQDGEQLKVQCGKGCLVVLVEEA